MMLGTGGGSKHESMNERECLKAISLILQRFDEGDRLGHASGTDGEASSEGLGPSDPPSGVVERPQSHGDGDNASRRLSQVQAFIARTRPQARRTTRSGRR